jgi:hypothetical protein
MEDPTECSTGTNPESWGQDQPENARENPTVIDLANARNYQTQDSCQKWITHQLKPSVAEILYEPEEAFVLWN